MITFADELEKIVVKHGVAADSLNRDLMKFAMEVYLRGVKFGLQYEREMNEETYLGLKKTVEKTKAALPEEG